MASLTPDRRRQIVSLLIVGLLIATILTQVVGYSYMASRDEALQQLRAETRHARSMERSLHEAEGSVSEFLRSGDHADLRRYFQSLARIEDAGKEATARHAAGSPTVLLPTRRFEGLAARWEAAIRLKREGKDDLAIDAFQGATHLSMLRVQSGIEDHLESVGREADRLEEQDALGGLWALALQLVGGLLTLTLLVLGMRSSCLEARARRAAVIDAETAHGRAVAAHDQVERLFRMTDMLQSASGYADANAVLSATADGLLPDMGCSLYVFNNSRDRLDLSIAWNMPPGVVPPETIAPPSCWALKRGKPHINAAAPGGLACDHQTGDGVSLEIPMMAKGEVYGLLSFFASGPDAEARIAEVTSITTALADAMSLALSNIALREKLRNQALRDPLTGLYNRRYLEDVLERFMLLAGSTATPLSVIMIDLDHFKRLNDTHGHALGDAVLRDVAEALLGGLRQSDVACRFGGEELTVLLPDTGLQQALTKAEVLRGRIEALSESYGTRITASMGVAAYPETSSNAAGLVAIADAALYEAKRAGRNRVMAADSKASPDGREDRIRLDKAA